MKKYDVFISYNWNDEKLVDLIGRELKRNNIEFFRDNTNLKLYDKLDTTLKDNIRDSTYLVAIISQKYLESYWCLFEAIEAISSEDLELKFLPIMVKYSESDVMFNENFIFESIENLTNEIESLENKIIKYKAFELSSKLDKLNFVKSNLPKIYERTQQRIYPIFELYNNEKFINNLTDFFKHIKPESNIDIHLNDLDFSNNDEVFNPPEINSSPQIKWKTYIGKQKWKNTPLILGDDIFVGSAGDKWNSPDEKDGVYCLNIHTGRIKWFYPTNSDVNKISFYDGLIVGGCDDGTFFCISSRTGKEKCIVQLDSGIVSSVYKEQDHVFLVATYRGTIYEINTKEGDIVGYVNINSKIMGDILLLKEDWKTDIYIPTIEGTIYLLSDKKPLDIENFNDDVDWEKHKSKMNEDFKRMIEEKNFCQYKITQEFPIKYPDEHNNNGDSDSELYSRPLIIKDKLFQAFARQTYYDYPAIICIDLKTKKVEWVASDDKKLSNDYGNIRTELLEYKDEIIFIHPYSNELVGISQDNGKVQWVTKLGRGMFQQWSSPIIYKDNIYIARHDGYLYKVDGKTKQREWGMYLGEAEDAGAVFNDEQSLVNESERADWDIGKGFSLFSTPAVSKGNLIIGSDEGYLYCISNINS
ncbi:toll/interleukin-1 receptor domain-containing protein [Campylobacterota bacterium DY0563]